MFSHEFKEEDQQFLEREILPFLPDRIIDAHAHLFCHEHYPDGVPRAGLETTPPRLGLAEFAHYSEWLHPGGRVVGGLFFGLVFLGDRQANNEFISAELQGDSPLAAKSRGQMIISPDMDAETILDEVRRLGMTGLKCYHTMAPLNPRLGTPESGAGSYTAGDPTWTAPIEAYLPDEHVAAANTLGLTITLHMVRDRALADPVNQTAIRRYCESYPNMRLILAHAARGFNPWHTIEGIESLRGLDNVWFDTSAVTEAGAFEAIVETMGHEKLMYGTDFHVSHTRGRCVAIGDSFHWLYADEMDVEEKHISLKPVLIGLESLRSIRLACDRLKLSERQVDDIFYGNAAALMEIE
ncbi:MAG: amidohydrolase family protein [Caldilineaceae bacterium SB0675_bin_29]|uniref:Amidohydrolase family protein n=1 Tax=Caldilineaceae bacterium SB0675_bin_29 TaxID=2605266 RepID=A0A6B1FZW3_9CHLR|nr:amidohydrolase family protein [Caldilineaceae bacterium SB0675_bin_29]